MRITVIGEGVFEVSEDGQVTVLEGDPAFAKVAAKAAEAALGPPLWAGPVEVIRIFADDNGWTLDESEVPDLPSEEGRVY